MNHQANSFNELMIVVAVIGLLAVGRHGGSKNAQLLRSTPPYTEWRRTDPSRPIGGPLLRKWGDRIAVGGRKTTTENGPSSKVITAIYLAELPLSLKSHTSLEDGH